MPTMWITHPETITRLRALKKHPRETDEDVLLRILEAVEAKKR